MQSMQSMGIFLPLRELGVGTPFPPGSCPNRGVINLKHQQKTNCNHQNMDIEKLPLRSAAFSKRHNQLVQVRIVQRTKMMSLLSPMYPMWVLLNWDSC